jgi:uncharacterized membrane protein YfcA
MKTSKVIIGIVVAVILAISAFALFSNDSASVTNDPNVVVKATSGPDNYTPYFFFNGLYGKFFSQGGGVLSFTATTTQDARTLTQAELEQNSIINILSTTSPALSLTLPATSTLTRLLKTPGDSREWYIDNQHLAATTTTIVAGAGIDLIAVTANDDVIDGAETSRLTCYRKANTDVMCIVSELLKAD